MFPAGIRAAPFPAYAWLPPARLLLEPVSGSRTLYVDKDRVLDEELGEDRLQEFFAVDVFAFFGLAKRDGRDDGVITVGWGVRGRVVEAENTFFGCRGGDFAF